MNGRLDTSNAAPRVHYCRPPEAIQADPDQDDSLRWDGHDWHAPKLINVAPEGTRFFCECGKVWVSHWVEDQAHGTVMVCAHYEWREETRRERRRRLGVRWWERG